MLTAHVSSDNPSVIKPILERIFSDERRVKPIKEGFDVEAAVEGESALELTRVLLSEVRRAENRTRIRAEWTSANTVERFFDRVAKGPRKAS